MCIRDRFITIISVGGEPITMINRCRRWALILLLVALLAIAGCAGEKADPAADSCITIEGSGVESAVQLTLGDLQKMTDALVEDDYFSINTYGTEEYFHFKGVWVWAVLEQKVCLLYTSRCV